MGRVGRPEPDAPVRAACQAGVLARPARVLRLVPALTVGVTQGVDIGGIENGDRVKLGLKLPWHFDVIKTDVALRLLGILVAVEDGGELLSR